MGRTRTILAVLVTAMLSAVAAAIPSVAAAPPLPNSMAATGDSMTQAFDIDWCCALQDNPQYSWSTGDDGAVVSHYLRIAAANAGIIGQAFNFAVTGARMAGLDAQVKNAAAQKVEYLTILMGANDLCTSTIAGMTPTAVFTAQFRQALKDFTTLDPTARIFVSSIPDIYQLWKVLHEDPFVQFFWDLFGICQSMLSSNNSEADRQKVVAQESADNAALAAVCAEFASCLWDAYNTFNFKFAATDVSTVDYFHPSFDGQNNLAAVTWASSYWPSM